jgi:hypothetical protein
VKQAAERHIAKFTYRFCKRRRGSDFGYHRAPIEARETRISD